MRGRRQGMAVASQGRRQMVRECTSPGPAPASSRAPRPAPVRNLRMYMFIYAPRSLVLRAALPNVAPTSLPSPPYGPAPRCLSREVLSVEFVLEKARVSNTATCSTSRQAYSLVRCHRPRAGGVEQRASGFGGGYE